MTLNDHFEGVGESASDSDDYEAYIPAITSPLDLEQFEYYWGDELRDLYDLIRESSHKQGWPLFEKITFANFVAFAYENSSKSKPADI